MTEVIPFFTDLLLIIGLSLPVLFVFRRAGLPPIAGFVLTGLIIGPSGLRLVQRMESVNAAAEIGVVLLLFTIGLEVSLSRMIRTPVRVYAVAFGQIVALAVAGFAAALLLGLSHEAAVVVGFVVGTSSSALIVKGLSDRGEVESPMGRMVIAITLAQDFALVPMLLVISFLSGVAVDAAAVGSRILEVIALGGVLYLAARFVLPPVMRRLLTIESAEVLLLFTILVMLGTAWLTSLAGLSLAMGAFAAGLILSETDYYPQIYAEMAPFRSLFASLFFVSVGMLVDLTFVAAHPLPVLAVAVGVLALKTMVAALVTWVFGFTPRISLQSAIYLAQIGELAFVLIGAATRGRLISAEAFQYLIAATSLTLSVTPFLMHWAPRVAWQAGRTFGWPGLPTAEEGTEAVKRPQPAVLVVGYGVNGQNVARVLREAGIYYEILDSNPEIVRRAREQGERIHYGEVARTEVLRQIEVADFDSVVLAISDPAVTRRAVSLVRALHPRAHLIVRTRYVHEVDELEKLGANVVVPEEFETSLRIFSDLLHHYRVPPHIIAMQVEAVRGHSYGVLRTKAGASVIENIQELLLQRLVEAVPILAGSRQVGKRLADLELGSGETCLVLSVLRGGRPLRPPFEAVVIQVEDLIVLYGNHVDLVRAVEKLAGR